MFNFALIQKILELNGVTEESIQKILKDLAGTVVYKFNIMFVLFINEKCGDEAMEKFTEFIEGPEEPDQAMLQKYQEWTEANFKDKVDFSEFLDKFEKEMEELEMKFVQNLKKNLNDEQRKILIDLLQDQIEYERVDEEVAYSA